MWHTLKWTYLHHFHPLQSFLAVAQWTIYVVSQLVNNYINWSLIIQQLIKVQLKITTQYKEHWNLYLETCIKYSWSHASSGGKKQPRFQTSSTHSEIAPNVSLSDRQTFIYSWLPLSVWHCQLVTCTKQTAMDWAHCPVAHKMCSQRV